MVWARRVCDRAGQESETCEQVEQNQTKVHQLKQLILDLHAGGDLEDAKTRFARMIGDVSAVEIAQMEQQLIADGLPAEKVQALCDVHVQVFQESLSGRESPEMTPGHPIHTFKYENFALTEALKLLEGAVADLPGEGALSRARAHLEQVGQVEKIYLRKENLLFPVLERHGVTGPSKVMWGSHDKIRVQLKGLRQALLRGQGQGARELLPPLADEIRQMIYKEEHILYPTALKMLSDAEWALIRDGSDEIGYCLVRPGDQWEPQVLESVEAPAQTALTVSPSGSIDLDTGSLAPEQINLLLTHLPVDVTFIDEQGIVRFYSQARQERIFTRTPAIIGRKVENCHPPQSVHVVNRLLEDFREGRREVAEFWIRMGDRFVHIRYFALRDAEGRYRGTMEVTQDIAPIQKLEGERRLLDEIR